MRTVVMSRIDREYLRRLSEENQARLKHQADERRAMDADERRPIIQAIVDEILAGSATQVMLTSKYYIVRL
jgi:hypothetical protein